jgi:hypothetical protein
MRCSPELQGHAPDLSDKTLSQPRIVLLASDYPMVVTASGMAFPRYARRWDDVRHVVNAGSPENLSEFLEAETAG